MATAATIAGQEVDLNDEGFMTDPDQWNEEIGAVLAGNIGIDMTDEHWAVIRWLREDYKEKGETATTRRCRPSAASPQAAVRAVPQEARAQDGLHRRPSPSRTAASEPASPRPRIGQP